MRGPVILSRLDGASAVPERVRWWLVMRGARATDRLAGRRRSEEEAEAEEARKKARFAARIKQHGVKLEKQMQAAFGNWAQRPLRLFLSQAGRSLQQAGNLIGGPRIAGRLDDPAEPAQPRRGKGNVRPQPALCEIPPSCWRTPGQRTGPAFTTLSFDPLWHGLLHPLRSLHKVDVCAHVARRARAQWKRQHLHPSQCPVLVGGSSAPRAETPNHARDSRWLVNAAHRAWQDADNSVPFHRISPLLTPIQHPLSPASTPAVSQPPELPPTSSFALLHVKIAELPAKARHHSTASQRQRLRPPAAACLPPRTPQELSDDSPANESARDLRVSCAQGAFPPFRRTYHVYLPSELVLERAQHSSRRCGYYGPWRRVCFWLL